jgi:single-stranded-DNA-specific exonuclease
MRVLVTDHHLPGDRVPAAACIVNPNQAGCDFPSKNLAGVGVIFYTMLALRAELRRRGAFSVAKPEPNLAELLDLVALGTVADVVKLDTNNRILGRKGSRESARTKRRPELRRCSTSRGARRESRAHMTSPSPPVRASTRRDACRTCPSASSAFLPRTPYARSISRRSWTG